MISQWLAAEPKLTLKELREMAVAEGFYGSLQELPDQSTLYRQLKKTGFNWGKLGSIHSDPSTKRDVIKFKRCAFRVAQDQGWTRQRY